MLKKFKQPMKLPAPKVARLSPTERNSLRSVTPNVGMKYQSDSRLMHDVRRDNRVLEALESVGCDLVRRSVTHAFEDMFRVAGPIVGTKHAERIDLWDILPLVQREINWAKKLPEAIFFELFTCLIEARHEWLKNLSSPPRARDNDRFIHQIDAFRRRVGDCPKETNHRRGDHASWILLDAVFFNELAGGLDLEEDEEEDDAMQDTIVVGGKKLNGDDGSMPHKSKAPAKVSTPTPMPTKRKQPAQDDDPRKRLKR
ncbi:hypothetical protein NPX13_g1901 [Xylaria arbuscula]|uniref:Uncharacterized protein n=1 Tax=Xylaria arbuscula TaxID=114810 RepID=A0A9W8NL58_9PEZI|nr:hypothetical protein NPX13_g1901 [Xylaria arbuscula]